MPKLVNRVIRFRNGKPLLIVIFDLCPTRTDTDAACSFVAENWRNGWMGQFMWGVFTNYMGLAGSDIIAMTTANFTGATDPNNGTSVYKGSSSFTRCVWEVRLGHVVSVIFIILTSESSAHFLFFVTH